MMENNGQMTLSGERLFNMLLENMAPKIYGMPYESLNRNQRFQLLETVYNRIQLYYYMEPKVRTYNSAVQRDHCVDALINMLNDSAMLLYNKDYELLDDRQKRILDDYMEELLDSIFADYQ